MRIRDILPRWLGGRDTEKEWKDALAIYSAKLEVEEWNVAHGFGKWVDTADVNPYCNIAHRMYRTEDGTVARFYGYPLPNGHRVKEWFFPNPEAH